MILGEKGIVDKVDDVSTLNSITYALRQLAKFVGKLSGPWNLVLGDFDQVSICGATTQGCGGIDNSLWVLSVQ